METKILITGATGATGKNAVKYLLGKNLPVRAMVHSIDARSQALQNMGAEIVVGDLLSLDDVSRALEGISAAYFVYPIQVPGILEATTYFIQAALEQGVQHIVNMSQIAAKRHAKSNASQNHWLAERLLDNSGIAATHLRPTFFAEWLMYQVHTIREQSTIVLPFGDIKYAPITGEDQGRVIAAILSDPAKHAGKVYPLYGAEAVNQFDIAAILSEVLGREITYIPMEIEPFKEIMNTQMGYSPWFIQHIGAVAQDCRDGVFSGSNDYVEHIMGHPPTHIREYITQNKEKFL